MAPGFEVVALTAEDHAQHDALLAELRHWRDVAGLSKKALARKMGYDPSYVSKIESGTTRLTESFVERADKVLQAGGSLVRQWERSVPRGRRHVGSVAASTAPRASPHGDPLLVEHDDATLSYDGSTYHLMMRRKLRNEGAEPVTRYLIRISVDRHPGDPERSNRLYREHPLRWSDLRLSASSNGERMTWAVKFDRDAFKEVWLLFENEHRHFPLYPGEATWIDYDYRVPDAQWGNWFQRAVRLPTERLSVTVELPADLEPTVWGLETSMTAEASPLRTAIQRHDEDAMRVFSWSTTDPPLHTRFRLEWTFKKGGTMTTAARDDERLSPADRMRLVGIVQRGDPILEQVAQPFDLPAEAEDARRVVTELQSAADRVASVHAFGKGLGLAAPQIGIGRAAAIVRPSDGETITLLNPRVVDQSPETDEQYEGCMSFFDVRGLVPRPLTLHVEHQDVDGSRSIMIFERAVARLAAHEIDHLEGRVYTARMREGVEPIPVSEYSRGGRPWSY